MEGSFLLAAGEELVILTLEDSLQVSLDSSWRLGGDLDSIL